MKRYIVLILRCALVFVIFVFVLPFFVAINLWEENHARRILRHC